MDGELKQYLESMEERLNDRIESTETKLLTAFYEWARPQEMRVNTFTQLATGFDSRLALLEGRVSRMERGDKH